MQETAFIWDLDGTLLDSYEAILAGIEETYRRFSLPYNKKEVRAFYLEIFCPGFIGASGKRTRTRCRASQSSSSSEFVRKECPSRLDVRCT